MKKKILALCLAILMTASLLPVTAMAAEVVDSGSFGDDFTWSLDSSGVLRIDGTGDMGASDGWNESPAPWGYRGYDILTVILGDGITGIGDYAFYDCENLESINIPSGVTRIGESAFGYCESLTELALPAGLESIGDGAFALCSSLTELKLGNALQSIGIAAFSECASLKELTIPAGVTEVGESFAVNCTALESISVDPANTVYASCDGVLFNKDMSVLIVCPAGKSGNYTVPAGVEEIGCGAFENCSELTEVILPEGLLSIGESAFDYAGITAAVIPDSVQSIGAWAFDWCEYLTDITLGSGLTELGYGAFCYSGITELYIPAAVELIDSYALSGCRSLQAINVAAENGVYSSKDGVLFNKDGSVLIQFPGGLGGEYAVPDGTETLAQGCFDSCEALTEITVPASVKNIEDGAFVNCGADISVGSGVEYVGGFAFDGSGYYNDPDNWEDGLLYYGDFLVGADDSLEIAAVKPGTKAVAGSSFAWKYGLRFVIIPDSVAFIGSEAFFSCDSLTGVTFRGAVPQVGQDVFGVFGIDGLTVYAPEGMGWTESELYDGDAETWNAYPIMLYAAEHQHEYGDVVFEPGCTQEGYTIHTCALCGESCKDSFVPAKGHNYVDGVCTECYEPDPDYTGEDDDPQSDPTERGFFGKIFGMFNGMFAPITKLIKLIASLFVQSIRNLGI